MPDSKRRHTRRRVLLRALTQSGVFSAERLGVVTDLSEGGAFIETHSRPARGTRLWVCMSLADGSLFHAYVEVVRSTSRGVGTRFVRLDPDGVGKIQSATVALH
ncbi:MAG: PilZ domain-containing protein [Archangiaceae bacterium]|nr:PilZ domain-containing protein [Archangiaceae bacterium]